MIGPQSSGYIADILTRRRKALPADSAGTTEALCNLGTVLIERDSYTKAEAMLLECHQRLKNNPDTPPARLNETVTTLVQLYEAIDAPTKAAEWRAKGEQAGTEGEKTGTKGRREGKGRRDTGN